MSKYLTDLALKWHSDGMDDSRVLDNVLDDVIYDITEDNDIELEMLLRSFISENIDWDALREADEEASAYNDAKRSAIYK